MALFCGLAAAAQAQILGTQAPGTPGAIEDELRPRRARPNGAAPRTPTLRSADAEDAEGTPSARRFGLKRNANAAARRQLGSGQTRRAGFPGASPAGNGATDGPLAPPGRSPRTLTGARFGNAAEAAAPPLGRPAPPIGAAPGLPPTVPPPQRRAPPEQDPYAPLGLRLGTMVVRPALEISGGYDTNPGRTGTAQRSSPVYRTEGEIVATSDWSRHQLDIDLRGAYSGFTRLDAANRPEGDARIALRLDASRDLTLESGLTARIDTEGAGSPNIPGNTASRTNFYTVGGNLGAVQRFGRINVALRGTLDRTIYDDLANAGVTTSQQSRNLVTYGLRLRAGYEITPGLNPFAEIGGDIRTHDLKLDPNGLNRDSRALTLRAGSTFEIARDLTGEISAGYTFRAYEDARLAFLRAPVVDAALTWSISPLTTLNLRAQSDVAETTLAGASSGLSYRASATLTHAFLRNFIATATLGISNTTYDGANRRENGVNAGLRLEYKFNRLVAMRGSYAFERLSINSAGESYQAHTFLLGLRFTP